MKIFNYYGSTDKGKVREFNEDFFNGFIHKNVLFLMLADGLGGKEGNIQASAIALNEMRRHIEKYLENDTPEHLKKIIEEGMFWANRIVLAYKRANETLFAGFGTTFTMCAITQNKDIVIGHAGNTRLYIFRNNILVQMTKDHSEAQKLLEEGKITKEELRFHPERATLTKALGAWEDIQFDVFSGKVATHDIVFLCSDGVFSLLTDDEIKSIISEAGESQKTCEWMIQGANQRGGIDNVSCLLSYISF